MTKSYLQKRFKPYGFKEDFFSFETIDSNTKKDETRVLFSSDEKDNILIHYHMLNGSVWTFHRDIRSKPQKYIRTRLNKPFDKVKYLSPKGGGLLPFFPPSIIEKFKAKIKIKTLYLIEGEIKAAVSSHFGLDCIGLGSIHGFYAPIDENRPHYREFAPEILELIKTCNIKNIVYLTDADTKALEYEVDKDMYKRANSFYSAVNNFRNLAKRLVYSKESTIEHFYFSHIKDIHNSTAKGLDDLLLKEKDKRKDIIESLNVIQRSTNWFEVLDLDEYQESHLKEYFGTANAEHFYEAYEDYIGGREFIFRRVKYYHDGKVLNMIKDLKLDDYLRIGTTYYKKTSKTRLVEDMVVKTSDIKLWQKGEITTDFGGQALTYIRKYDDFVNFPNWMDYRQVVNGEFNVCVPLPYVPKMGVIDTFIMFIQHIASNEKFLTVKDGVITESPELKNNGTILLDYLSIMLQHPTNILPIACFISNEQETGKTTFAQLLTLIFQGNSAILQTKDFTSDFNSLWASKFFICIDEGKFNDKREAKDQLKYLSTSATVNLNTKGVAQKEVDNFSKVWVCTNDEDGFIQLEKSDLRFLLIKVPSVKKRDPNLKGRLFKEIPAITHYLANREIFHKKTTRQWFADDIVQNELFWKTLKTGRTHWKIDIDSAIQHIFDNSLDDILKMTVTDIQKALRVFNSKTSTTPTQIRTYFKRELGLEPQVNQKYDSFIVQRDTFTVERIYSCSGRPYEFLRKDFK